MLNFLWAGMILIGVVTALLTGNMADVTNGVISSAGEAVTVCIKTAGLVAMWSGLMRIAERSGAVASLTKHMRPVIRFLFPRLDMDGKAAEYISVNFISNILGLGWAATPAGLAAMAELHRLGGGRSYASREMCTFMIINMSSLQLITVSVIGYRAQYGSARPSEIIGPGLLATAVSCVAAVTFAKTMDAISFYREKSRGGAV